MHLNIFASQSCFVHCKGCYSLSREEEKDKIFPTDKLIKFLKYAYDVGTRKVTLCGGDPLSRDDIIDLLEKIKKIGYSISLDTVGSPIIKNALIDKRKIIGQIDAKKIAELVDVIGIPIDGSTNEVMRRFRKTRVDIVSEQLAICEELHAAGANICINTVAHKGNLEDAQNLAELIKRLDYINKWQVFQYMPLGKYGIKNRELFEITDEEFLDFQSAIIRVFDNDISKLQFKSSQDRMNTYMLIDNSGNAWIPSSDNISLSKFSFIVNGNRIIGNVGNPEDWNKICSLLDRDFSQIELLHHQSQDTNMHEITSRQRFVNTISNNGHYRSLPIVAMQQEQPSAKNTMENKLESDEQEKA